MKEDRLSFLEAVKVFGKALKVSLRARGASSLILSLVGFAVAFLPMLVSLAVRSFSDAVQQLYGQGEAAVVSVLGVFAILSALYIVQLIWGSLSSYFDQLCGNRGRKPRGGERGNNHPLAAEHPHLFQHRRRSLVC